MPTTPLGFTYPASTGHGRIWEHLQTMAQNIDGTLQGRTPLQGNASLSSNYTLTASMADLTGASVTINIGAAGLAVYFLEFTGDFTLVTAGSVTGVMSCLIDGVPGGRQVIWNPANAAAGVRATVGNSWAGVVSGSGNHTFKLQAQGLGTPALGRLGATHTGLSVVVLPY
ncbi:hypothetical protein [Micromonospora sp. C81]|uniref:hypothetical protein n=1 Tax=Micromonospora sp. C81 TaxID=2824881 RepID=UPI001B3907DE|nr:hypothetical protein [Micromonospora sp. C81]MBQ1039283.1 hypothetical protein [Micromonospora sp. C81]